MTKIKTLIILLSYIFINYSAISAEDMVIVKIENRSMKSSDLEKKLAPLEKKLKKDYKITDKNSVNQDIYQNSIRQYRMEIINDWKNIAILAIEAEKSGFTVTQDEVNKQIDLLKGDDPSFNLDEHLKNIGANKEQFLIEMKDAVLGEKLINKKIDEKYPPEKMEEFYKTYKKSFIYPAEARIERIAKLPYRTAVDSVNKQNSKEMKKILKEAKKGVPFQEIVSNYNDSITDEREKLKYFEMTVRQNSKTDLIYKETMKLKEGKISDIIEVKTSLNIIKLIKKTPLKGRKFEEVKDNVRAFLYNQIKEELLKELEPKYKVNITLPF